MNIVGYKSPFKKKNSPMKLDPATAQVVAAVAPAVISGIGSLFGRRKRRRERARARAEMKKARRAFEAIEFTNPFANLQNPYTNLTNPYAGMQNPYAENLAEDLTVDTQAADFLREQQQQSQADLLANLRSVAGGSGVAGLAQSLSNVATQQAQQASAQIAQQERANEMARIKGEQQRRLGEFTTDKLIRQGQFGVEKMQAAGQSQVDMLKARGEAFRSSQEQDRIAQLYGLSIGRKQAADQAISAARSQFIGSLGQAAAGVAGLYAPGGSLYGTNPFEVSTGNPFNETKNIITGKRSGGFGAISG
tara:strand:+ start:9789 stop:10706 length:918 start_codon:yes stop_codon:yes gene_type:complete